MAGARHRLVRFAHEPRPLWTLAGSEIMRDRSCLMTGSDLGVWVGLVPLRPDGRTVRIFDASLVRSFRVREGLTQQELAIAVSASRATIASIEQRRSVPSVSLALAIAERLGATVEELFAPDDLR